MPAKVIGRKELARRLALLPNEIRKELRPAIVKGGEDVVEMAKRLAPVGTGPKGGELRDSIRVEPGDHDLMVVVKAGYTQKVVYAAIVEFGSVHQAQQPFFYPSYRALKNRIRRRIGRAFAKGVKASPPGTIPPKI